jgi:hypothetical protein
MKRTTLAVLMIALALVALAAPMAYAQAPAPKVTINGLIDNLTTYSSNVSNADGVFNRNDKLWYARTRGRFDFIGEVGKAKAVLGIELDHVYGQAGSNDSTIVNAGGGAGTPVVTQFGTDGSFDLNTDSRGIIEIKWLYVEFPAPLIPVPTTVRLGAQPFGGAASYKLATYANGDFPGVNIVSTLTPNVKLLATYVQVEENLVGTGTKDGKPGPLGFGGGGASLSGCSATSADPTGTGVCSSNGQASQQNRGDDYAYILAAEVTPFKGLDIKPMFSMFYAQGTTSSSARKGRGGINTGSDFTGTNGASRGGINEYRYTAGLDARFRMGPLAIDPSVLYQWGQRAVIASSNFADAGAIVGRKYHADINAWLVDVREGYQLGPLLLEALQVWSTGNKSRNTTLDTVSYFQPLDLDTSYLADWGPQLTALGLDYLNAMDEAGGRVAFPGDAIGWDKYGRIQLGVKATYAITPALSAMAGVNWHWTAEAVDKNSTLGPLGATASGIVPVWNNPGNKENNSRYVGTELMALLSWKFADNLVWDNAFGYMFAGQVLSTITDATLSPRNAKDPYILTSRVRFTF